ncbi:MAG: hypothetical protein Q7S52_04965 [bacterium]|nr:hypothetical protein [bacterium]
MSAGFWFFKNIGGGEMKTLHEWKRIDASIARCLQCSCGFKAGGYTWEDVYKRVAEHEATTKTTAEVVQSNVDRYWLK